MAKLKSSFKNMFISLSLICIVSATILAGVYELTTEPIVRAKKNKLENAIRSVIPDFDNNPTEEIKKVTFAANDTAIIYYAKKNGELVGMAVETQTMKGFSGMIRILTGLTPNGKIINYEVLEHSETPGLGDKMDPWFKTSKNNQNVIGENLSHRTLKLSKQGGSVDAITAATITSAAFLDAINKSYMAVSGKTDGDSGASSVNGNSGATSTNGDSGATTKTNSNSENIGADGNSEATTK